MRGRSLNTFWLLVILLSFITVSQPVLAQSEIPPPPEIIPLARGGYIIKLPDGTKVEVESADELTDYMTRYADRLSEGLVDDVSNDIDNGTQYFTNLKDELSDEVSNLIGEQEDKIMEGISDKIAQLASMIADVGTTPAGEVERLKKMVADGYSAQQRITYQTLKVDYAWKKSHTALSPEFCSYYKELNIKGLFVAVKAHVQNLEKMLSSPVFTAQERQGYQTLLKSISDTKDLASAVNIVCNLGSNGKEVTVSWMAQGERMDVLDQSAAAIKKRLEDIGSLRDELRRIYVYRIARQQSEEFKQGSFQKKSGLNHVYQN